MSLDTSKCSSGGGGAGGLEEDVEGEDKQAGELFLCTTYQIKAGFFCSLWKKLSVEKTPIKPAEEKNSLKRMAFKTSQIEFCPLCFLNCARARGLNYI